MKKQFKRIDPEDIRDNVFKLIDKDWMLITAGPLEAFNTMTASWGALGILWNKQIAICFVRPQRYTYRFMEENDRFTLCFFDERYREALNLCGSTSGRNTDKVKAAGLTPVQTEKGTVFFGEARLVIECRKIYYDDLKPEHFLEHGIHKNYPLNDYHRIFIGEIIQVLKT
jgi:flavin reductase (DIM6/NTAB) family NADH-FMN oxidoreductase RutF